MAWATPKTNWSASDGVRNTDMNRIEGNTQHLYDNSLVLQQHINTLYAMSQQVALSALPVGAEFYLRENNILVPYIVVNVNYNSTGRVLVLRKNSWAMGPFNEGSFSLYDTSRVDAQLNNEFLYELDEAVQAAIATATISVAALSGTTTIARKVFLLSRTEYNFSGAPTEGSINHFFSNPDRRTAMFDGFLFEHWTRTVLVNDSEANYVTNTGALGTADTLVFRAGIRPAFTLPLSFNVTVSNPNIANVLATAEVV